MERGYLWFVVAISVLAALPRLVASRRIADLEAARYQNEKVRNRRRKVGNAMLALTPLVLIGPLIMAFALHRPIAAWVWVAIAATVVTGAEWWAASRWYSREQILTITRISGIANAAVALGVWWFLLR